MIRGRRAARTLIFGGLSVIVVGLGTGTAGADPSPFTPGPSPVIGPWPGAGFVASLPDPGAAEEQGGQQLLPGGFGFVCNNQGVICPW